MNDAKKELMEIEKQLNTLVKVDKQNWSNFYLLLKKVEDEELWKEGYKTFTAWIKHFAHVSKLQESVLWNRKRAGEIYQNYYNRKAQKNEVVADIKEVEVAQDTLILIQKIAKDDIELQDQLTDKAINKELKKKDLQQAYKIVKAQKEKEKKLKEELAEIRAKKTSNNNVNIAANVNESNNENKIEDDIERLKTTTATALDISNALNNNEWLAAYKQKSPDDEEKVLERFKKFYKKSKYSVFTEFPVHLGTTRHSRRIDALVCENITSERYNLNLHGIEIKVSKHDLEGDHKYTEYAEFVDYLWLAVPEELVEVAKETKLSECGILVINQNKEIKVIEKAERLSPVMREKCLEKLALKLL